MQALEFIDVAQGLSDFHGKRGAIHADEERRSVVA
jgi:hypothetical protein